eukprot:COSAG05_NODE_2004_length_3719_cov_28.261393_1_plen_349_part_00
MTGGQELWYTLPIPYNVGKDGRGWHFVLALKFVELRHNATGKRLFGINLNGLQVLTGIDLVEEVGFAHVYDEEIEFKLDTENWLLWVTSVGKMQVRMDQPAAFSLTGELHVGITPQQGNARLCGLQVTQGKLTDLYDERKRRLHKGKKRKKRGKKHRGEDDDDDDEDDDSAAEESGASFFSSTMFLTLCVLALTFGTLSSWDFGGVSAADKRRLPKSDTPAPITSKSQINRLSTAEKKQKADEKRAALDALRKREMERKAAEDATKQPEKKPTAEETEEEKQRRLEREYKKRLKQDKAREESMKAEARALATAKEARRMAERKSSAALAALQEIQEAEEADAARAQKN